MQRGRAPPIPNMYGGNHERIPENRLQIPRPPLPSSSLHNQPPVIAANSGTSKYKLDDYDCAIHCKFGFNALLDIIKISLAEFLGTMILMYVGCSGIWYPPITFGIAITIAVQAFGQISGAHINPSVTILSIIMGQIHNIILIPFYIIAQFGGAYAGYALYYGITAKELIPQGKCAIGGNVEHQGTMFGQEFLLSLFYFIAICAMWDNQSADRGNSMPLKRGIIYATICACIHSSNGKSGQFVSLNSLRALVPATFHYKTTSLWSAHWIFWVAPNVAAIIAGGLYRIIWWLHKKTKFGNY